MIVSTLSGQTYAGTVRGEYVLRVASPAGTMAALTPTLMAPLGVVAAASASSLQLVFASTPITKGSGVISIYRNRIGDDPRVAIEAVVSIDVSSPAVSIAVSGGMATVTIALGVDLSTRIGPITARDTRGFVVRGPAGLFMAGNQATAAIDGEMWRFWIAGAAAPMITALSPSKGATIPGGAAMMVMVTFNKWVTRGTGTIQVRSRSDDTVLETFNVADSNRVMISGRTVRMQVSVPAVPGLELFIAIPANSLFSDGVSVADLTAATAYPLNVFQAPRGQAMAIVDRTITTSQTLTSEEGSTLGFTASAIPPAVSALVATRSSFTQRAAAQSSALSFTPMSDIFNFEPDGIVFTAPVMACLKYDTTNPITSGSLVLAKQVVDSTTGKTVYQTVPGDSTIQNSAVCGMLSGFSSYIVVNQIVAPAAPGGPSSPGTPSTPNTPGTGGLSDVTATSGSLLSPSPSSVPIVPVILSVAAAVFVAFAALGLFIFFRRKSMQTNVYDNSGMYPVIEDDGGQIYSAVQWYDATPRNDVYAPPTTRIVAWQKQYETTQAL